MKNDYVTRAQKFIRMFAPYLADCQTHDDYEYAVLAFNMTYHRKVRFTYGATRIVFITSDYVIKITHGRAYDIESFGGNEQEYNAYQWVKETPYKNFFAEINKYDYNDIEWYIMPFIHGVASTNKDATAYLDHDAYDFITEYFFDLHRYNYGWRDGHIVIIDYAACRVESTRQYIPPAC